MRLNKLKTKLLSNPESIVIFRVLVQQDVTLRAMHCETVCNVSEQVLASQRGNQHEIIHSTKKCEFWIWPVCCCQYSQHKYAGLWGYCDTNEFPSCPATSPIRRKSRELINTHILLFSSHAFPQPTHTHKLSHTHRYTSKHRLGHDVSYMYHVYLNGHLHKWGTLMQHCTGCLCSSAWLITYTIYCWWTGYDSSAVLLLHCRLDGTCQFLVKYYCCIRM